MPRLKAAVDSFLVLLAIALLLLVVMAVVFGVFGGQLGTSGQLRPLASFTDLGAVGFLADLPARSFALAPFTAGEKQTDTLKIIPELTVSSGTFGSQALSLPVLIPSFYGDSLTGVKIAFDVYRAGIGNLRVKWNGKEVLVDVLSASAQSVFIPKADVKPSNTLDILADGPGFAFWASNSYTLRGLIISAEYGPAKLFALEFSSGDLQSFTRGEVSFFSLGEGGTLSVKINGAPLLEKNARGFQQLNFTLTSVPLTLGNNILSFSSTAGEFDIRNGEVKIFTAGRQQVRERSFNLTADQLTPISQGTIRLTLSSVSRPGSIRVYLNTRQIFSGTMETGTLTGSFPKDAYQTGANTLQLGGTGAAEVESVVLGGN